MSHGNSLVKNRALEKKEAHRSREEIQELRQRIISLCNDGSTSEQICDVLSLKASYVYTHIHQLVKDNLIAPRRRKNSAGCQDLNGERPQIIIKMVKEGRSLKEIGDVLSVTRERARQLVKEIKALHGQEVFRITDPFYGTKEVARELGVSRDLIVRVLLDIRAKPDEDGKNSTRTCRAFVITGKELQEIREHSRLVGICQICGKAFNKKDRGGRSVTCSNSCCQKMRFRRRKALFSEGTKNILFLPWHKELKMAIQKCRPNKNEHWVNVGKACLVSGLSRMQIHWLGRRGIVVTKLDPVNKWRDGRSVALYPLSIVRLAGEIYRKNQKTKK